MGKGSFEVFFDELTTEEPVSLQMSYDALLKARVIEISIENLLDEIRCRAQTMGDREEHKRVLEEADMDMNKTKQISKIEPCMERVEKYYATNCKTCKQTCHVPCKNPFDVSPSKYLCEIFTWGGNCIICEKHCPPQDHESSKEKHATRKVMINITKKQLIEMYSGVKMT